MKDCRDETPLHNACLNSRSQVPLLIQNGADVNQTDLYGTTPLMLVATSYIPGNKEQLKTMEVLLRAGARISYSGQNPLHIVAQKGCASALKLLLDYHSRGVINVPEGDEGKTILHYVACRADVSLLDLVLGYSPDLNSRTRLGYTPLHTAVVEAHQSSETIVRKLLERGACVHAPTHNGYTPIFTALCGIDWAVKAGFAYNGHTSFALAKLLLGCGADIRIPNKYNTSPLSVLKSWPADKRTRLLQELGIPEMEIEYTAVARPAAAEAISHQAQLASLLASPAQSMPVFLAPFSSQPAQGASSPSISWMSESSATRKPRAQSTRSQPKRTTTRKK